MLDRLRPDEFADSVMNVDYTGMYARGVKGIIFDIDNTLEGYEAAEPSQETADFLRGLVGRGFKVSFASNNSCQRVERFNIFGFPAIYKAGKPGKKAVWRASEIMGVAVEELAIIGDQVFTDVICGKRCGIYTVLVKPVTPNDPWYVALKRIPERWIVKKLFPYD